MKLGLRRTLMLAGGSLAIAGLMAAYSYTTASVANSATLSVVDTNAATLGLSPGNGYDGVNGHATTNDLDQVATESDGNLTFDFNNGLNGGQFGLQQNSTYEWDDLFKVTNNSNNPVQVSLQATGVPAGVTLYANGVRPTDYPPPNAGNGFVPIAGNGYLFTLPAGHWGWVDIKAQVGAAGISGLGNMTFTVNSTNVGASSD